MKKLLLLALVMLGGVMQANAWSNVYLRSNINGSTTWDSDLSTYEFTKLDDDGNNFLLELDGSVIQNGALWFRPNVYGWGQVSPAAEESVNIDNTGDTSYETNWRNTSYYFIIGQNANASKIFIRTFFIKSEGNDNKTFGVQVLVLDNSNKVDYTVNYFNTYSWSGVKAYIHYNGIPLNGKWPGTLMTSGDYHTTTVTSKAGTKIIFVDSSDEGNKTSEITLATENPYYSYFGQNVTTTINSGYATFSNSNILDFEHAIGVKAYYSTEATDGKVIMSPVTTSAANKGLFLQKIGTEPVSIPITYAGNELTGNLLFPTDGNDIYDSSKNRYVLANTNGIGFYKVISSLSPAQGKAYLETASQLARMSFIFEDEPTSINSIETTKNAEGYYDLQGRRVAQPTKGLYIVNGKKFIK